jgi:hypothetical protein
MMRIRTIAASAAIVAGGTFLVAGPYMVYRGFDARAQVRAELKAENITTPADASRPNVRVVDGPTAIVQAEVIQKHALKATGGKTFAEMERTDPNRQVAWQASTLRTALLASALAWNVANLVIGLGVLVFALGAVALLVGLAIRKPEQILLTTSEGLREPIASA